MENTVKRFLSFWLYLICAIGGVLAGLLVMKWSSWSWSARCQTLAILSLIWHVMEEWRFPGGFHYMLNADKSAGHPELYHCYPMNQLSDMLTNLIPILCGCLFLALGSPLYLSMMWFYLCFTDSMGHIVLGHKMKKKYAAQGKRTIYNPGLVSSLLGFLPTFALYLWSFFNAQAPTAFDWAVSAVGCAVLHVICLQLPEKLFSRKDTPYGFNWGSGYFEKFEQGPHSDTG
ncbi:HXXEE domain-containing protein [Gemmiger sp.]|uniref:HXXEE domain-containing protein n=1 Tax=Gemmiger sp. TaxID=2049027 RepID=UPI003F0BC5DC